MNLSMLFEFIYLFFLLVLFKAKMDRLGQSEHFSAGQAFPKENPRIQSSLEKGKSSSKDSGHAVRISIFGLLRVDKGPMDKL